MNSDRVRASAADIVPVAGVPLFLPIYKVPIGYRLAARRVTVDLGALTESNLVNAVGISGFNSFAYYRSGVRLQWALTVCPEFNGFAIPGVETWGEEQGPTLTSGEVFETRLFLPFPGIIVGSTITITLEGLLSKVVSG